MKDEMYDRIIELCKEYKTTKPNGMYEDISKIIFQEYDWIADPEEIRQKSRNYRKQNELDENFNPINKGKVETIIKGDGSQEHTKIIRATEDQIKDAKYLLEQHGYKPGEWELVNAKSSIWDAQKKGGGKVEMYSSKITVKPKNEPLDLDYIREFFKEEAKRIRKPTLKPVNYTGGDKMLEIALFDAHFGKLAWHGETGEDYDHKIATERFLCAISDFINRAKKFQIEKILAPIGQDLLQYDNAEQKTDKGTPQDTDMRPKKMYTSCYEMMLEAVLLLREVAPVHIVYSPGNHDPLLSYFITHALAQYFHKDASVQVDIDPSPRKYVEYGKCLIGYSHGDDDAKQIPKLMQIEAPEAWGRTMWREWHMGHLHKEGLYVDEDSGLIMRRISAITGTDKWHSQKGFVGTVKKAQAFVWDREYGLMDILNSPIIVPRKNLIVA